MASDNWAKALQEKFVINTRRYKFEGPKGGQGWVSTATCRKCGQTIRAHPSDVKKDTNTERRALMEKHKCPETKA